MPASTFVIVTAYNEAELIGATLDAVARAFPRARVLLADDGSTDDTPTLAAARGAHVVRSERVIGKGGAATLAAREALSNADAERRGAEGEARGEDDAGGEPVFVLCDGDLGDSAARLGALVDAVERGEADLAVAAFSRRVGGGFGVALGFARWAIRRRCGLSTRAPISGQRALSAATIEDVLPFAHGFGMELGMTIDAVRAGHRVVELDLDLEHRASGRTLAGFAHRGAQLLDFARAYLARGPLGRLSATGRSRGVRRGPARLDG
ncbi:MAG TPA: glycosyltransferase [Solirubrobacteraceae bacterium]|nr:glycosyltransferase [Solirubrobacteraceae bacterium]